MVNVRVKLLPSAMLAAANAFEIVGGSTVTTVRAAEAAVPVP